MNGVHSAKLELMRFRFLKKDADTVHRCLKIWNCTNQKEVPKTSQDLITKVGETSTKCH